MISEALIEALIEVLIEALNQGLGIATRSKMVQMLRKQHPELDNPRLDLQVAGALNHLIEAGILSRTGLRGRMYYHVDPEYWARQESTGQESDLPACRG